MLLINSLESIIYDMSSSRGIRRVVIVQSDKLKEEKNIFTNLFCILSFKTVFSFLICFICKENLCGVGLYWKTV